MNKVGHVDWCDVILTFIPFNAHKESTWLKMSFSRLKTVTTFKPLLSSYCQSSNVLLRSGTLGGKPLGTWINRLKRWQSGSLTDSSTSKVYC